MTAPRKPPRALALLLVLFVFACDSSPAAEACDREGWQEGFSFGCNTKCRDIYVRVCRDGKWDYTLFDEEAARDYIKQQEDKQP